MIGERCGGAGPAFQVFEVALGGVAGVAARGEVEISTAAALSEAIDEGILHTRGPFVIDLCAVDFLDSSGIHCLVRARALLAREDRALALVCPPGTVRRVLEMTGLDELVPLYDSRDELIRVLGPPPT
jgi:anti-sigma B factor antagonist